MTAHQKLPHSKCITSIQNVLVYHDSRCYTSTDRGIIHVDIEEYQTVDSIEIIISNSQFNDVSLQPIIIIRGHSNTIICKIWIINCTFESISVDHTSIITAEVSQFNTELNFLNCEFRYCSASEKYLVSVVTIISSERNVGGICTNITFNKCNFSNNDSGLLYFRYVLMIYCTLNILLIGPAYISDNEISCSITVLIY